MSCVSLATSGSNLVFKRFFAEEGGSLEGSTLLVYFCFALPESPDFVGCHTHFECSSHTSFSGKVNSNYSPCHAFDSPGNGVVRPATCDLNRLEQAGDVTQMLFLVNTVLEMQWTSCSRLVRCQASRCFVETCAIVQKLFDSSGRTSTATRPA